MKKLLMLLLLLVIGCGGQVFRARSELFWNEPWSKRTYECRDVQRYEFRTIGEDGRLSPRKILYVEKDCGFHDNPYYDPDYRNNPRYFPEKFE